MKLEKKMVPVIIFLFIALGASVAAYYFYIETRNSETSETVALVASCNSKYNKLEELVNANVLTVSRFNERIEYLEASSLKLENCCAKHSEKIDSLDTKSAALRDSLSNKRPVVRIEHPIPVQVIETPKKGQGVKSLLKKSGVTR